MATCQLVALLVGISSGLVSQNAGNSTASLSPEYDLWDVFRYEDVEHVLSDYSTFTTEFIWLEGRAAASMGNSDPPRHHQLRTLVAKAFTPRSVAQMAPRITTIVDDLLDRVVADGNMDLVVQLALPLPVLIIATMLGVPPEDQVHFHRWTYQLFGQVSNPDDPDNSELRQYFSSMLNEREKEPRDDLMSALIAAEENGEHLTREDVVVMCEGLLAAGTITTTSVISHAISLSSEKVLSPPVQAGNYPA